MASLADYAMIANSVGDDTLTPQESGIRNQQLKSLALGNKGKEFELGQAQKSIESQELINRIIQKNSQLDQAAGKVNVNHAQVAADLANAGYADKAYEYMDIQQKKKYEDNAHLLERNAQLAQGVMSLPEDSRPQAYQAALNQARQMGIDTSEVPQQYDPNYLTSLINMAVDAKTYFNADQKAMLADKKEAGANQRAQLGDKPYHTTFSTADGVYSFDSRTGLAEKITDAAGNPIIKESADVALQRALEKNKTAGKNEANRADASKKAENLSNQLIGNIQEARNLLSGATGSLAGAARDKIGDAVGIANEAGIKATQLETLAGWMVANVPRMEGPQSNIDVENYRIMAARVGDRTIPVESRLAALDTLEKLQNKYKDINRNVDAPSISPVINQGGSGQGSSTPGINSSAPTVSNW